MEYVIINEGPIRGFWGGIARLHIVTAKQESNMKEFGSVTGDG